MLKIGGEPTINWRWSWLQERGSSGASNVRALHHEPHSLRWLQPLFTQTPYSYGSPSLYTAKSPKYSLRRASKAKARTKAKVRAKAKERAKQKARPQAINGSAVLLFGFQYGLALVDGRISRVCAMLLMMMMVVVVVMVMMMTMMVVVVVVVNTTDIY